MEDYGKIEMKAYDPIDEDYVHMQKNDERDIESIVKFFRRFLGALSYSEEQINKFIIDPSDDYSLLTSKQQMYAHAVLAYPDEECCKCCGDCQE